MLYIPKQVQNPLLMFITVSPPYNIKLYLEMNYFQTTSKEHGLITVQSMSPAFQTWRIFKNRWFCNYCIQSFMLKYISHYSWLQADCICYSHFLPFYDAARNLQIQLFYWVVSVSHSVLTIHPGGQVHSPVTWWQMPPFWHGHLSSHCGPCLPGGQRSSQLWRWRWWCKTETIIILAHLRKIYFFNLYLAPLNNISPAYKAPVYPGGHLHSPVTWSQVAPFWHWHFWWQSFPYVPWSQRSSQRQPLKPDAQRQAPVMGLHKAPFLHWQRLLQWGPQWSLSHAKGVEGKIYRYFIIGHDTALKILWDNCKTKTLCSTFSVLFGPHGSCKADRT